MRNRGNGKGGGIAMVGLDPEQFGVDAATLSGDRVTVWAGKTCIQGNFLHTLPKNFFQVRIVVTVPHHGESIEE
jgi:hypothetical protein